jgi:hypothetical protein
VHPIIETRANLQTYLSLIILAVLVITAIGIFLWQFRYNQFRYNPAVLNLDNIVSSTAEIPQTQKTSSVQSRFPIPEDLVALSPPEVFEPPNLSDKINGKAELYLSAGFVGLQTQRFKRSALIHPTCGWRRLSIIWPAIKMPLRCSVRSEGMMRIR